MTYCTQCGQPSPPNAQFCMGCGHAAALPAPPVPTVQSPVQIATASLAPQFQPQVQKRSGLPFLLVALGILVLVLLAGVGGVVYIGYRVKEKVTSVAQAVSHGATDSAKEQAAGDGQPAPGAEAADQSAKQDANLSNLLGNLGTLLGGEDGGDPVEAVASSDPVAPCSPAPYPGHGPARVPLQAGTILTGAWGVKYGDVSWREAVESIDADSLTFSSTAEKYKDDDGTDKPDTQSTLTVCNSDFASSNTYATISGTVPRLLHDMTRERLSDNLFQEIKSSGKVQFTYFDMLQAAGDLLTPVREGGELTRVEAQDVAYPLIVNDQPVTLPVIHLAGFLASTGKDPRPKKDRPAHQATDIYVVDDAADPLVLLLKIVDPVSHDGKFRIEVTKIDYSIPHPVNLVEKQLAETKRAVTWGIYFDFNKDTIKPESAPVLKQIVEALRDNPDWKLTVAGNTDNIGGDVYNLDLSKRRAAAVKQALVTQYNIAPERLSTDGYGASHSIETNDTLEGRARNRRVELTRE